MKFFVIDVSLVKLSGLIGLHYLPYPSEKLTLERLFIS
jgi:hypothetical protein